MTEWCFERLFYYVRDGVDVDGGAGPNGGGFCSDCLDRFA